MTEAKTFNNQAAQGDLFLRRIEEVPPGFEVTQADAEGGVIVAHSETGHHHVMLLDRPGVEVMLNPTDPGRVVVRVEESALLEHRRSFDTHAPILFKPGVFELRRQREATPDGWQRVTD